MKAEIERRPAWLICIGLVCASLFVFDILNILFLVAACGIFYRVGSLKFLIPAFCVGLFLAPRPALLEMSRSPFDGELKVVGVPEPNENGFASVVRGPDGRLFRATWSDASLSIGDVVHAKGTVAPFSESEAKRASLEGLSARIRVRSLRVEREGPAFFEWSLAMRSQFLKLVAQSMPAFEANAAMALCFNVDTGLADETLDDLRRTGTIHIISASGLHVLIYVVAGMFILSRAPIPRSWQIGILLCALVIYAGAAGFRPPIVRSAVMCAVVLGAYAFRREADLFNALGLAAMGYLIFDPPSLFDVGFQLSFATVGGLALFGEWRPVSDRSIGNLLQTRLRDVAVGSLIASAFSAPLVAYHFGQISMISLLANVLISGLIAPILILSMVALGLSYAFFPFGAAIMQWTVTPLVDAMMAIIQRLSDLPFAAVNVPEFSAYWLLAFYIPILILWRKRERKAD